MIKYKKFIIVAFAAIVLVPAYAQKSSDKAVFKTVDKSKVYYYNTIAKGVSEYNASQVSGKPGKYLTMDVEGENYPNKLEFYDNTIWHQNPVSQGKTGTCWAFSTTSFYESEAYRLSGKKIKLSEMYTVYWEYVEKAKAYVESRGKSRFTEGSEANAVTRMYAKHGVIPFSDYSGMLERQTFYDHSILFDEMWTYLQNVKKSGAWNEKQVIETIKSILNKYIGTPPTEVVVDGKKMSPKEYLKNVLKIVPADYVDILSYMQEPYYQQVVYSVPDNWWNSDVYYNIPLEEFMETLDNVIEDGFTVCIDADVSEVGLLNKFGQPNVGVIPDFDIPFEYINDAARQFRFSNKTTTDDHLMHLVASTKEGIHNWYLIKDSSSGSRNNGTEATEFGYYFFRDDYVKLKVMSFTVHKDAVKKILKKFKTPSN